MVTKLPNDPYLDALVIRPSLVALIGVPVGAA